MAKSKIVRQNIRKSLDYTLDINYSSFDSIRAEMASIEKAHPEYTSFEVSMESVAYDDSDREYPHVYGIRPETDEEVIEREAKAARDAAAREARDRAEYVRLAARFGIPMEDAE